MSKKIVNLNGKTYIKDAEGNLEEVQTPETTPTDGDNADKTEDTNVDAEAMELAQKMGKEMLAVIKGGIKVDQVIDQTEKTATSTLKRVLSGDTSVVDQLSKEEKICGFFHALCTGNEKALNAMSRKALAEGVAADGGYLFPNEFLAELIRPLQDLPRMRSLVRVITMRRDVMEIPTNVNRPQVYWTAENATKTTTTASFSQKTLTVKKMAAIMYASDELVADSTEIDVVNLIIELFAEAIGLEEDRVITAGNGTTEPTGLTTASIAGVTCSGNLDFDDIIDLVYSLPQAYHPNAVFLTNRANIRELRKLKDSQGQYLWSPSIAPGQPNTIMGYPVYENNFLPDSKIYFGDFKKAYYLGDRQQMTVKISNDTETAFTKDQTAIRVVERIAGNVVNEHAVRVLSSIP